MSPQGSDYIIFHKRHAEERRSASRSTFFYGAWRVVSEDSFEKKVFPADCPHSIPFSIGDTWEFPAYSHVLYYLNGCPHGGRLLELKLFTYFSLVHRDYSLLGQVVNPPPDKEFRSRLLLSYLRIGSLIHF